MTDEAWRTVRQLVPWLIGTGFVVWAIQDYARLGVVHSLVDEGIRVIKALKGA